MRHEPTRHAPDHPADRGGGSSVDEALGFPNNEERIMTTNTDRHDRPTGALAPADVQRLSATVEVAPGAIVSRTLAKTDGGTVTVFAFDQGQLLSEHTAPFDAMVNVLEGVLTVTIGDTEQTLEAGDVVLMPADVPHGVVAPTAVKWMLVMLKANRE
jgi:quercetin dioxygenase-like cupin family protein